MAPIYCDRCKQIFDTSAALESHRSVPNVEFFQDCEYTDVPKPAGITPDIRERLRPRWRKVPTLEKWDRIYSILFPDETIPLPCKSSCVEICLIPLEHLKSVCAHELSANLRMVGFDPSQRTPSLERPSRRELRFTLRLCFARSANEHIQSLPDAAKAEIVEVMVEECIQRFNLTKSPNFTPRGRAPLSTEAQQYRTESQTIPLEEQIRELPMENWGSQVGEDSNQGLGLYLQPSAFQAAPPRGRSFTSPNIPSCSCPQQCVCPPPPSSFFKEQFTGYGAFDMSQSPDRFDSDGRHSSM
jgi:hypothetical protein